MRFSAASCGCASRSPAIAPGTMPYCWPRRHPRGRATGWSISAPVSGQPASPSPDVSPVSKSFWSKSTQSPPISRAKIGLEWIAGQGRRADIASGGGFRCRRPAADNRRRADESAVQRSGAAPVFLDKGRETAHMAQATTLGCWIHAPAGSGIRRRADLDLACRCAGRDLRSLTVARSLGFYLCMATLPRPRSGYWFVKGGGRRPRSTLDCCSIMRQLPNPRAQDILAGRGRLPLAA